MNRRLSRSASHSANHYSHRTTNRTQRAPARLLPRVVAPAVLALAALFIADRMYDPAHFPIRHIEVHGRFSDAVGARIQTVAAQSLSGNFFSQDLSAIESRLEQLPRVVDASVRRKWPADLVIEIRAVEAVATWGDSHWVHTNGDLVARGDVDGVADNGDSESNSHSNSDINSASARTRTNASANQIANQSANQSANQIANEIDRIRARELPRLSGPRARHSTVWRAYQRWAPMFAERGLWLARLNLDARGLWRINLRVTALADAPRNDALIELTVAHGEADELIARFCRAVALELNAELAAMHSVDLRYPNGFAVGWKARKPQPRPVAMQPRYPTVTK